MKIIGDADTDEVSRVHGRAEVDVEAALAIEMGATVEDLGRTIHATRRSPEAMMEAAELHGMVVHIYQKPEAGSVRTSSSRDQALPSHRPRRRVRGDLACGSAARRGSAASPDGLLVEHDPVVREGCCPRATPRSAVPGGGHRPRRRGDVPRSRQVAAHDRRVPGGRRDPHRYLGDLGDDALRSLGIEGRREPGKTGVWIGPRKVCSIGVAVRRWVTWHGLGLNVTTDLDAFRSFAPCGLDASVMTRVADHLDAQDPAALLERVRGAVADAFRDYWRSIADDERA